MLLREEPHLRWEEAGDAGPRMCNRGDWAQHNTREKGREGGQTGQTGIYKNNVSTLLISNNTRGGGKGDGHARIHTEINHQIDSCAARLWHK